MKLLLVPDLCVTFRCDFSSLLGDSVVANSNLLRDDGVFVLTIGVGSQVSTVELRLMATTFAHVFQFTSADEAGSQKARIASAICGGKINVAKVICCQG